MIRVLEDHPGTRIGRASVDDTRVVVVMQREPMTRSDWVTHDYNVHFCVGLENGGNAATIVDLSVDGGNWDDLPAQTLALYAAAAAEGPYDLATFPARTDLGKKYCARIPLAPGERVYVANTLVRSLDALTAEFDSLGRDGNAERRIIGRSLQGRDLVAYIYGDSETRGTLLVSSGFHPPEPDTLATAAIMRHLAGREGRDLVEKFAVAIVPLANPDGYAMGTQGANASGINMYWHFAKELPDRCPEAAALWQFAVGLAPRGYIDFHCYTFQQRKAAGPYQRPPLFHTAPAVRAACRALYAALDRRIPGKPVTGFGTYAPHTLGAMLTETFDTIALAKYHLHLAEGVAGCRKRGFDVFMTLTDTLIEHGLTGPGARRPWSWRTPLRNTLIYWSGLLRPTLGWVRRGRLDRVRLDRTALVPPDGQVDMSA